MDSGYWLSTAFVEISEAYNFYPGRVSAFPSSSNSRALGFTVGNVFNFLNNKISSEYSIYLTRGGSIDLGVGSLWAAGFGANYWSRVADAQVLFAYSLGFNSVHVYPLGYGNRWSGFTGRKSCKRLINLSLMFWRFWHFEVGP